MRRIAAIVALVGCAPADGTAPIPVVELHPNADFVRLRPGRAVPLEMKALYGDRSFRPPQDVRWECPSPAIANCSATEEPGAAVLYAGASGTALVRAIVEDKERVIEVDVTPAPVVATWIDPPALGVPQDELRQAQAWLGWGDGVRSAAQSRVSWSIADPAIASVDASGQVFGVQPGETQLQVFFEGLAGPSIPVHVGPSEPVALRVGDGLAIRSGMNVSTTFQVSSEGPISPRPFWVDLFVDWEAALDRTQPGRVRWYLPTQPPSTSIVLTGHFEVVEYVGEIPVHDLLIDADRQQANSERDAALAAYSTWLHPLELPGDGPDLRVDDVRAIESREGLYVAIDVVNQGSTRSGAGYVDIYLTHDPASEAHQGMGDGWARLERLEPGASTQADVFLPREHILSCEGCQVLVRVDSLFDIDEVDEENNLGEALYPEQAIP